METYSVTTTPRSLDEDLAGLEGPSRKEEREQFDQAVKAAKALAPTVSKRESLLVTISVHSDPDAEGFDARSATVSVQRLDPEAAEQARDAARERRELAEEQAEAAERNLAQAREAEKRAGGA